MMDPRAIGGLLLILGGLALIAGLFLLLYPRGLAWLGRLPGDFQIPIGQRGRVYIPLGTSLLLSLLLSLLFTLLARLLR
ncbi:MAG: DUF2905 family protein [Candidatus Acetothermia bacterium]|jgi:hypothetical protein|nr:DUF2905 family protein [Candidatus Acetothermia bacterium]MDH7505781.1 DUF2905 family protein [Candidatus Acetothermia bacterium]